jgi:hypothetical protein
MSAIGYNCVPKCQQLYMGDAGETLIARVGDGRDLLSISTPHPF